MHYLLIADLAMETNIQQDASPRWTTMHVLMIVVPVHVAGREWEKRQEAQGHNPHHNFTKEALAGLAGVAVRFSKAISKSTKWHIHNNMYTHLSKLLQACESMPSLCPFT